jgi:hypothetical protein
LGLEYLYLREYLMQLACFAKGNNQETPYNTLI